MVENFAGNIIVNLASLPDFLRAPILKKRMTEFFSLPEGERLEVVSNALDAGHAIPFPSFARLLKTWLQAISKMTKEQRDGLFLAYIEQIASEPARLVPYNLDGLFGVYLELEKPEQDAVAESVSGIVRGLDEEGRKKVMMMIPDGVAARLGL